MSEPTFRFVDLIENDLQINCNSIDNFKLFESFERLINAANAMRSSIGDFTGINICIHVASSFVLLESSPGGPHYHRVADNLKRKYSNVDPSVILTSSALYYMLQKIIGRLKNEKERNIMKNQYINYLKEKANEEGREISEREINKVHHDIEDAIYKMEHIITRFTLMNWMIGKDIMEGLDIPKSEYNAEKNIWVDISKGAS